MNHERLFLDNAEAIDAAIRLIVRQNRLPASHAEEFTSIARLKLIENDYEVLRRFQGRSTLATFLHVVLQRVLLDYRVSQWGRWRPSAEARRRGALAIQLEQFVHRDGLSVNEAIEVMKSNHGVQESRAGLLRLAEELPQRPRRRLTEDAVAADLPDVAPRPDEHAAHQQLRDTAARASRALAEAVGSLDTQEQLIVRLRFQEGLTVADVARALALDQKPLYRRIDQLLDRLRTRLERAGVSARAAADLFNTAWSDLAETSETATPAPAAQRTAQRKTL